MCSDQVSGASACEPCRAGSYGQVKGAASEDLACIKYDLTSPKCLALRLNPACNHELELAKKVRSGEILRSHWSTIVNNVHRLHSRSIVVDWHVNAMQSHIVCRSKCHIRET